ncbi:MAG: NAD(P)-dependent oxidoreductase [Burkholderiaceae bacterium]
MTSHAIDVAVCASPTWPHLDPIFKGVCSWLQMRGYRYGYLSSHHELLSSSDLLQDVRVIVGYGNLPISSEVMQAAPQLHGVVSCVSGTDGIDLDAATQRGVLVAHACTPESFRGMAESAVLLMLHLMHNLDGARTAMQQGLARPFPMNAQSLHGKTIGLVGWGKIASMTASLLQGWGVQLRVFSRRGTPDDLPSYARAASLDELMSCSDVVCVVAGAEAGAPPIVGREQLARMKPSAYFMNLSRGSTTDELAVAQALQAGRIAGAALDVFSVEPLPNDSPLWACPNLILTPHRVGHTHEADESLTPAAIANVQALLLGQLPPMIRNPQAVQAWRQRWQNPSILKTKEIEQA